MNKVRCGIIGCGVIGPTHIRSIKRCSNAAICWVCDAQIERAQRQARIHDIPNVTADYRDVLGTDDCDAVFICLPHYLHGPVTVAALDAGKHVLCEKPLGFSSEHLDEMMAAHERNPHLVFGGVFQHRFDPVNQYIRSLVEEGVFGRILTANLQMHCLRTNEYYGREGWRGTWDEEGGSVLINQAIHYIDILAWVMGGVACLSGSYVNITHEESIETEDTAVMSVRFANGALGTIEATSGSHIKWEPTVSINGSEGGIDIRNSKPIKVSFRDEALQERIAEGLRRCKENEGVEVAKACYGTSHPAQIAEFIDAVGEGRQPFVTAQSARHAADVVLALYRSHREGGWVDVPAMAGEAVVA